MMNGMRRFVHNDGRVYVVMDSRGRTATRAMSSSHHQARYVITGDQQAHGYDGVVGMARKGACELVDVSGIVAIPR
jgi:hypothetical protein